MRNPLSVLALAVLVGGLPGTALAQRRPRRPAPQPSKDVLKRIDQRLDRLERSLKGLAAAIGRLNRTNSARDARIRRLEAVVKKIGARKPQPPVPPHHKAPPRRPAPPKAHPRVFSFGGKISPEVRKRIESRLKEAMKKMPPERRERIKAFLKKIKERKEKAEKRERGERSPRKVMVLRKAGERKGWSPLRVRAEKERREGREHSFRFFSPERIREFARKHPQIVRWFRRMRAMRTGRRFGHHGPMMGRPGMRGMARPPMMMGRRMGTRRGMMGRKGRCGMGRCMHHRERMGRRPAMPFHGRFRGYHRPAGPQAPKAPRTGRFGFRVRPFHHHAGPKGKAPMGKPRVFVFHKGEKGFPQGFKAMVIGRMKKEKAEARKHWQPRRILKARMEHHRKGPKVKKAEKSRFRGRKGRHESKERKGPHHGHHHGKLV